MLAGESIYMLPYLRKTFQTSMEDSFGVGSMEVGVLNSMFGLLAIACYFPGGRLADHFSARKLLTTSLVLTGLGGLYMATLPSYRQLLALHAFWGVVTILTFWAALIKATRNWGGTDEQGKSFGLLDGGRGVIAGVLASLGTTAFALANTAREGLIAVILVYAVATFVAALAVWLTVPDTLYAEPPAKPASAQPVAGAGQIRKTLAMPKVWFLSAIVFCAYLLFLGTYDFPAFAERGFEQSKLFGAQLGTFRDWLRPVAAIGAGLIADRVGGTRTVSAAFVLLLLSYCVLMFMPTGPDYLWLLWIQVAIASMAAFALRGVYFALLQEARIPMSLTGTTVGIVSVVGFAPDIFAHTLSGWFVRGNAAGLGYQAYFGFLAGIAVLGLLATAGIHLHGKRTLSRAAQSP